MQTRLPKARADQLAKLAKQNERTVAAELRVAIDKHLKEETQR